MDSIPSEFQFLEKEKLGVGKMRTISEEKNKSDQSKSAPGVEETDAISGRTIHPEITPQRITNEKSITVKLKHQVSKFVKKKKSTELNKAGHESLQESIYDIRYREMKLNKEDIDQIQEMKNYSYLRFDKLKDTLTPLIYRKKKKKGSNSLMF